ncbi:MAG: hypothetical protein JW837_00765 [Sedimentisphaerales bacterium]|nr:hypothetical protein [Sedimentisphaerales bacterium]
MSVILASICIIILTGFVSLFITNAKRCVRFGAAGIIAGSVPAVAVVIKVLYSGTEISLKIPWQVPYGSFYIVLDSVSSLFLIAVLLICSAAAIYGCEYMMAYKERRLGIPTFFFNMLTAGMAIVVIARNSVLFLVAWEIMSLASYFLVTFDDEHESVRKAGWIYIIATHIGTAFLLFFFVLLSKYSGTMDFDRINVSEKIASLLFILALVGFGTKAGIMPLHVWLPEAHPAAPSHVSAVMSGVMIKTGIYGIIRTLIILPSPPAWWGWLLVIIGAVSGVFGVLLALAQHDLKRLLAYHSVENIGIIVLGLGIGTLGLSAGSNILTIAGFAGALLHVVNHALFKGLLFFGAGAVVHTTGTRNIDVLGGIIKKMPFTAAAFVIGAIAICGLPPLNGFISEFMVYYGAFVGTTVGIGITIPALLVIGSLSLIGGLALACFTKAFGFIFLGEARSDHALRAHEVGMAMQFAMWTLACGCIVIGFFPPFIVKAIAPVIANVAGIKSIEASVPLNSIETIMYSIVLVSVSLILLIAILCLLRNRLLIESKISKAGTWDCGYVRPTSKMQYTASSFAQPLTNLFRILLQTHFKVKLPKGFFPDRASFSTHTPDVSEKYLFEPVFLKLRDWLTKLRMSVIPVLLKRRG